MQDKLRMSSPDAPGLEVPETRRRPNSHPFEDYPSAGSAAILCTWGPDVIRKEAWSFYRTSSGVRLCWELEEPKGPKGILQRRSVEEAAGAYGPTVV